MSDGTNITDPDRRNYRDVVDLFALGFTYRCAAGGMDVGLSGHSQPRHPDDHACRFDLGGVLVGIEIARSGCCCMSGNRALVRLRVPCVSADSSGRLASAFHPLRT